MSLQCEFEDLAPIFEECNVDGDLLLLLTEENLRDDLDMSNGILRKRSLSTSPPSLIDLMYYNHCFHAADSCESSMD